MQITDANNLLKLEGNEFIGEIPKMTNTQINFNGKNNILICEKGVHLWNSRIDFNSDNSILYLSNNNHDYCVNISMHNNNLCFIGKNNFFNGQVTIVLSESKNVLIGGDCIFSYNIVMRVADGHLIYDSKSHERINHSKSIFIGDHVWLGQNSMIFKGTQIGSGAIVGANSVVSSKSIPSNTTFAGNPVKLIHEDSFWTGHSVHNWFDEDIKKMENYDSDRFIFNIDNNTLKFEDIENKFNSILNAHDFLDYIESNFLNSGKNRFTLKL